MNSSALAFAGAALVWVIANFVWQRASKKRPPAEEPAVRPEPKVASVTKRVAEATPAIAEPTIPEMGSIDDGPLVARTETQTIPVIPRLNEDEDEDDDITRVESKASLTGQTKEALRPPAIPILMDPEAESDEPTGRHPLILVSATGQSDRGKRRKANEDSLLVMEEEALYVVADGMGGYNGGALASKIAVDTLSSAFRDSMLVADHEDLPRAASELAHAMQLANSAILTKAESDSELTGMGTTLSAARFSRNKQRLYIGHVGDSRVYRLRGDEFRQITADHTMADFGLTDAAGLQLSRAVGIWPTVPIDMLIGKPLPNDIYLMCSDGLTKMVADDAIAAIVRSVASHDADAELKRGVSELIELANSRGGRDNVSVILLRVKKGEHQVA